MAVSPTQQVVGNLANFIDFLKRANNNSTASLTKYTNQVNILGRVYAETTVLEDDIMLPLMSVFNQMYICWILCALGLDSLCADGRTVSQRLQTVAGLQSLDNDVFDKIEKTFGSAKVISIAPSMEDSGPVASTEPNTQRLVSGRLIEFDFNAGQQVGGRPSTLKAYFYVALYPTSIPSDAAMNFMIINTPLSFSQRWTQLRTGEISFFKDFLFCNDILTRERNALKNDKSGTILEMMGRQGRGPLRWAAGMLFTFAGYEKTMTASHNLANAFLVFDKMSFDRACRENHLDFNNVQQREKFFRKTWCMVVAVVDLQMGIVNIYYAGIDAVGTYSFAMINKIGSSSKDSFDLKEVMTAMSQGQAPRF